MPVEFSQSLDHANDRLKVARTGIRILQRGNKLSLRGTLPDKSGQGKKQQTIALDVYANPAGLKRAEAEAYKLSSALALKEFDWADYVTPKAPPMTTVGEIREAFERDYFNKRPRNGKTETTFKTEYLPGFNGLQPERPLTSEMLEDFILRSEPDTRSRLRYCIFARKIADFAGLKLKFSPEELEGNYSPRRVTPRQLPPDQQIREWHESINHDSWRYAFGLMACYGLRNHEIFNIDLDSLQREPGVLTILDGKTGPRRVWPFFPGWWEEWRLWDISRFPRVNPQPNNAAYGRIVYYRFKKYGITKPYNLRHAWAVRTLELGLDLSLAAAQMGHSVGVHSRIYHHWVSEDVHQRAFEAIKAKL